MANPRASTASRAKCSNTTITPAYNISSRGSISCRNNINSPVMASNPGTTGTINTISLAIVGRSTSAPVSSKITNINGRITAHNNSGTKSSVPTSVKFRFGTATACCETPGHCRINRAHRVISIAATVAIFASKVQDATNKQLGKPTLDDFYIESMVEPFSFNKQNKEGAMRPLVSQLWSDRFLNFHILAQLAPGQQLREWQAQQRFTGCFLVVILAPPTPSLLQPARLPYSRPAQPLPRSRSIARGLSMAVRT